MKRADVPYYNYQTDNAELKDKFVVSHYIISVRVFRTNTRNNYCTKG